MKRILFLIGVLLSAIGLYISISFSLVFYITCLVGFPIIGLGLLCVIFSKIKYYKKVVFFTIILTTLVIVGSVAFYSSVFYNVLERKANEKVEIDKVILIPSTFHGCINIINVTDTSFFRRVINNKAILDTIVVDTNGIAITPVTYFSDTRSALYYLIDSNKKLQKINLITKDEERLKSLPAIKYFYDISSASKRKEIYDYRKKKFFKQEIKLRINYFLFKKNTCYCNFNSMNKNIDSVINEMALRAIRK